MTQTAQQRPARPVVGPRELDTLAMWLYVLVPAAQIVLLIVLTVIAALLIASGAPGGYPVAVVLDSQPVSIATTILAIAARAVLARLDSRAVLRLGVARPMPWGWGVAALVYTIGRGVVLRRSTGAGLLLTWVGLAVMVVTAIVDRSGVYDAVAKLILG